MERIPREIGIPVLTMRLRIFISALPACASAPLILSVHFMQALRKCGESWFPWPTTSIIDARIFDKTAADIRCFDYLPRSATADRNGSPELVEARYVKR